MVRQLLEVDPVAGTLPRLTQSEMSFARNRKKNLSLFSGEPTPAGPHMRFVRYLIFSIKVMQMKNVILTPGLAEKIQAGLRRMHQIRVEDPQTRADAIDEARRLMNWERLVFLHEPAQWLDVFEQHAARMDDGSYWRVLLRIYCRLDTVAAHTRRFRRLFKSRPVEPALRIDPVYIHWFHAQPDQMKIYRGYAGPFAAGFSWTLNRRIAKFFAYRAQERLCDPQIRPQVLMGLAQKKDVVTLVLSGTEAEVIIDPRLVTHKKRRTLGPLRGLLENLIA